MFETAVTANARRAFSLIAAASLLAGCMTAGSNLEKVQRAADEASVLSGSAVRRSTTPFDPVLSCYGKLLAERGSVQRVAVGNIRDLTGRQEPDAGFVITQGGALMAYSALGKLGDGVRIHERSDTNVAEAELNWINNRQLGDGRRHSVENENGDQDVPWIPYFGGSILQSGYYIVGGITEVNYNIQSGGAELRVGNVGPRARTYTMNIAVDLRIVGTQTLLVYDTVTVEKQLVGYEVGFGVFRFFGSELFDVNMGQKVQEPLHFGVRLAIESGVLQLLPSITNVPVEPCLSGNESVIARDLIGK